MKDGIYGLICGKYCTFTIIRVQGGQYSEYYPVQAEFSTTRFPVQHNLDETAWKWLSPLPEEWTSQPTRDGWYKLKIGQTEKEIEVIVQGRRFLPKYSSTHQFCHNYGEKDGSQWLYLGPDSPVTTEPKQETLPQRALTVKLESGHLIVSLLDDKGQLLGGGSVNLADEINAILDERMSSIRVVM